MRNLFGLPTALAAVVVSAFAASAAHATAILTWQSTSGFAGTESSLAASAYGTGITNSGGAISRASGLTGNAGGGSLNSAGWTTGGYLTFSLTTTTTGSYSLTGFQIQDKPSATGPGNMGLYYSGNGFSAPIASWATASGAGQRQESPTISGITLAPSTTYTFEIKPTNSTANNGGSTGAAGTYRIISPTLQLNGDVVTTSSSAAALATTASDTVLGTANVQGAAGQFVLANVATGGATKGSVAIAGDLATSGSAPVLVYVDLATDSDASSLATSLAGTGVTATAGSYSFGGVNYDLLLTYSANPSGGTSPFYFNYSGFAVNNVGIVPEPAALGAIAPAAMLLGRRRRA